MCTGAEALIIGSTAVSAISSIAGGRQAKGLYDWKADQADADADAEEQLGAVRAGKVRKAGRLVTSQARAAYGASGVEVDHGTPATVQGSIRRNVEEDALTELLTGKRRATVLRTQGAGDRLAGENAERAGYMGAATSLLQGAASYAGSRQDTNRWIKLTERENDWRRRAQGGTASVPEEG